MTTRREPPPDPEFYRTLPNFGEGGRVSANGVLLYDRTSPDRPGRERTSPELKRRDMKAFAESRGLMVAGYAIDEGKSGYSLKGREQLRRFIGLAVQLRYAILAWDVTRLGRSRPVLRELSKSGATFLVLRPFHASEEELQREMKRRSQAIHPGGRPRNKNFDAALLALNRLPGSLSSIAREMNAAGMRTQTGAKWTHKQVSSVVGAFFTYRDELAPAGKEGAETRAAVAASSTPVSPPLGGNFPPQQPSGEGGLGGENHGSVLLDTPHETSRPGLQSAGTGSPDGGLHSIGAPRPRVRADDLTET